MKKKIYLQRISEIDSLILNKLKKSLEWNFRDFIDSVEISTNQLLLNTSDYDQSRRQYNASLILGRIMEDNIKNQYFRVLGVIDEDIYTRYLNFVFGIALLPKKPFNKSTSGAIISVTRLREEFYRRKEDPPLFELRILKEAHHELGHTFGLKHCENICVMKFSNSLADTDKKPPTFCESCMKNLKLFFSSTK